MASQLKANFLPHDAPNFYGSVENALQKEWFCKGMELCFIRSFAPRPRRQHCDSGLMIFNEEF
jgi:hypothetical protein